MSRSPLGLTLKSKTSILIIVNSSLKNANFNNSYDKRKTVSSIISEIFDKISSNFEGRFHPLNIDDCR